MDSVRIGGVGVDFKVVSTKADGFVVQFPRMDTEETGSLLEVVFDAPVLRYGTRFSGRVFDSQRPLEVHQAVEAGDAALELESDDLTVRASLP